MLTTPKKKSIMDLQPKGIPKNSYFHMKMVIKKYNKNNKKSIDFYIKRCYINKQSERNGQKRI